MLSWEAEAPPRMRSSQFVQSCFDQGLYNVRVRKDGFEGSRRTLHLQRGTCERWSFCAESGTVCFI